MKRYKLKGVACKKCHKKGTQYTIIVLGCDQSLCPDCFDRWASFSEKKLAKYSTVKQKEFKGIWRSLFDRFIGDLRCKNAKNADGITAVSTRI